MQLLLHIGNDISSFEKISYILGGIAIFLFGINLMSDSLKSLAGNKLKLIIEKTTNTPVKGILTGMVITALIQSSSGTTAIVVALVSAGLMTLPQTIAVVMGANIGTTITSIIIGLNISEYSFFIIAVGALLCFFSKKSKIIDTGKTILGFGLLFIGLELMGDTLKLFAESPIITKAFMTLSDNPLLGVGVGAIVTAVIQSSSAAIAIVQTLYSETNGGLSLAAAIPILLGSNIGTTITAVLSSLSGTRNAKRAALAHVIFNLIGTLLFIIILNPFISLMGTIEESVFSAYSKSTIATAHVIFNVTTTLLLAFFIDKLVWIVKKIIKPSESEEMVSAIDKLNYSLLNEAPTLALENAHLIIIEMSKVVNRMFDLLNEYISVPNEKKLEEINSLEDLVDVYDNKLHDFLAILSSKGLDSNNIKIQTISFDTIRDLERIADHLLNIAQFFNARYDSNIDFHPVEKENITHLLSLIKEMISDSFIAFAKGEKSASRRVMSIEPQIDELEKKYRKIQLKLFAEGELMNNDLHYVDILANLERIGDHCNNIAENILNNSVHYIKNVEN